jgi:hypothetical protein
MAELSYYWNGTVTGDANQAAYSDDEFSDVFAYLFTYDRTLEGVLFTNHSGFPGLLQVTNPAGTTIRVATGVAMVDGKVYTNSANVDLSTSGDGGYSVVLRKDFAAQTVRAAIRATGVTQTDGATWEIKLADVTVSGGVHTITDQRRFIGGGAVGLYKIERVVVPTGGSASIDFQSIPQTFHTLRLDIFGKTEEAGGGTYWEHLVARLNNDGGANYSYFSHVFYNAGGSEYWSSSDAADSMFAGVLVSSEATVVANSFGNNTIEIVNYSSPSYKKALKAFGVAFAKAGGDFLYGNSGGFWTSTDAVNRITLTTEGGSDFAEGSVFTLYGIN